jgi:hypothetical protein
MTPQIITLDTPGRHNADFEAAAARIRDGGGWKKQRIIMILPAGATVPTRVVLSWIGMIWPPNQPRHNMLCEGMEVGEAYSGAIEAILAHPDLKDWEYVLTLEHDNIPPPDGAMKLLESMDAHPELSCIGGLYWTKGEGGVAQVWGDPKDPVLNFRPQVPIPETVQECCGTGMGFNLFRLSMFRDEKLRRPFFKTLSSVEEGLGTQDLYFWGDARKHGYRCAIDTRVRVGHHDSSTGITW